MDRSNRVYSLLLAAMVASGSACTSYAEPVGLMTQEQITQLTTLLVRYVLRTRRMPQTMEEWLANDTAPRGREVDDWGRPFVLRIDGGEAFILSAGADGVLDSQDDFIGAPVHGPTSPSGER